MSAVVRGQLFELSNGEEVNSPEHMNPKKNAAHSITLSKFCESSDHNAWILVSRSGVIGRSFLLLEIGDNLWIPFSTYCSLPDGEQVGSGSPARIWWNLMAQRYDQTVCGLRDRRQRQLVSPD